MDALLELVGVSVEVAGRTVCSGVDLRVEPGEVHVLFGRNGSGKSSLVSAIMGVPPYEVTAGEIRFHGERIDGLPVDQRARLGIGMAFQRPPALNGVTLETLGSMLAGEEEFHSGARALSLDHMVRREVNAGFSGGELKRWEVLKTVLQAPQLALFDEPESGVDLGYVASIGTAIADLMRRPADCGAGRAALVITHTGLVLEYLGDAVGHVMRDGSIVRSGSAAEIFAGIQRHGYDEATASAEPVHTAGRTS